VKKESSSIYLYGAAVLVVVIIGFVVLKNSTPSVHTSFAECLAENDVKMYGAWWCSHCENQKTIFGNAFDQIEYIECSDSGSRAINETCKDIGLKGYPTWEFSDGSRLAGEVTLEVLAEKTGCELPTQ